MHHFGAGPMQTSNTRKIMILAFVAVFRLVGNFTDVAQAEGQASGTSAKGLRKVEVSTLMSEPPDLQSGLHGAEHRTLGPPEYAIAFHAVSLIGGILTTESKTCKTMLLSVKFWAIIIPVYHANFNY